MNEAGFVDIHSHFVYGVDDGARSLENMLNMLDMAWEDGIRTIVATPHISPGVRPFNMELFNEHLDEAKLYCATWLPEMSLTSGCEMLYTPQSGRLVQEDIIPRMGNTSCVLLEFSPDAEYETLERGIGEVLSAGARPILAHAERYNCLLSRPTRIRRLKEDTGVSVQINASSIVEAGAFMRELFIRIVVWERLADVIATDAHNTLTRVPRLRNAWQIVRDMCDEEYADHLTDGSVLYR